MLAKKKLQSIVLAFDGGLSFLLEDPRTRRLVPRPPAFLAAVHYFDLRLLLSVLFLIVCKMCFIQWPKIRITTLHIASLDNSLYVLTCLWKSTSSDFEESPWMVKIVVQNFLPPRVFSLCQSLHSAFAKDETVFGLCFFLDVEKESVPSDSGIKAVKAKRQKHNLIEKLLHSKVY